MCDRPSGNYHLMNMAVRGLRSYRLAELFVLSNQLGYRGCHNSTRLPSGSHIHAKRP